MHGPSYLHLPTSSVHASQLVGVGTALLLIDRLGRRPLLIGGSAACCLSMLVIAAGDASADVLLLLAGMCSFIVAFRHVQAVDISNTRNQMTAHLRPVLC